MDKGTYIHALDNGLFTLGAPHKEGWCLIETVKKERHLKDRFYGSHILSPTIIMFQHGLKEWNYCTGPFHLFPFCIFTTSWQLPLSSVSIWKQCVQWENICVNKKQYKYCNETVSEARHGLRACNPTLRRLRWQDAMVVQACHPNTQETEVGSCHGGTDL